MLWHHAVSVYNTPLSCLGIFFCMFEHQSVFISQQQCMQQYDFLEFGFAGPN